MAVIDDLGVWLQGQLDTARAAGAASRQAEVDAAAAALADAQAANAAKSVQIAQLTAQLAAKQAELDAYVKAHPDVPVLPTVTLTDFAQQNKALFLGAKSLTNPARYVVTGSTKSTPTSGTNQYRVMMGGLAAPPASGLGPTGLVYSDFEIDASDVLNECGCFMLGYSDGAQIKRVRFGGSRGSSSLPPGEVPVLDLWHAANTALSDVILDGRLRDGTEVGSTLLEHNKTVGTHTCDKLDAQHAKYGFCVAMDESTADVTYTNCYFGHSRRAINIEHARGGTVRFQGCRFEDIYGGDWFLQISSLITGGKSTKVVFEDCTFDRLLKVRTYPSSTNNQLESDIRRIENGQDVTADPSKFLIVHA